MTTIVGIDPHPQHHTAAALDAQGQVQGVHQFDNSPEGLDSCLAWLEHLGEVHLAVEGPTQTFLDSKRLALEKDLSRGGDRSDISTRAMIPVG